MLLATRCPHCETVFRLQEAQLSLRGGLVRCGHCQAVFNAPENLVDAPSGEKPLEASAPADITRDASPAPVTATPAREAITPPAPEDEPAHPVPDVSESATSTRPPAAEPKNGAVLSHDTETSVPLPLVEPDSRQPEPTRESVHVAEPVTAAAHANDVRHEAEPSFAKAGDVREPSFTAWHARESRFEPDAPAAAVAAEHADDPTFSNTAASSWGADPEPRFRSPPTGASAASESFGARAFASRPDAAEPFATSPDTEGPQPFAVVREKRVPAPGRLVWRVVGTVVALVLAALLIAQLAWWQRETVMVYWPGSQPLFAQVCEQLGCQIAPPRDIDGLQVEASDLRQVDGPYRLELRVPLRNRYNVALAYPALELTLLDAKNNITIRRVLWPQDYVRPGTPIPAGLPARTTQTMIVRLDTGNVVASNFRVQIFYP